MNRAQSLWVAAVLVAVALLAVVAARAGDAHPIAESPGGGAVAVPHVARSGGFGADPHPASHGPCPEGMMLVDGDYCPRVEERCIRWMDPPGKFHEYRCAEYARPSRCVAQRVHKRFCIDRRERSEDASGLPLNMQSWSDAKRACQAAGARVCLESEWTFACEGEELRPYPYGYSRQARACNADRTDLLVPGNPRRLRDSRERSGSHPDCMSPFGVLDMAGNVAEWVSVDGAPEGSVVVQKGNWWQPGKHACRDAQAGHNRFYKGTETGFRCCASLE
jgi:sulfatase modifying factor 1